MQIFFQWLVDLLKTIQLWVVVLPWERCVRVRLGQRSAVLEPGVHWKIPWVDRVWPVNNRFRLAAFPAQTLNTADGKTITAAGVIAFRISNPLEAMMALKQPEWALAGIAQSVVAGYIPCRKADELNKDELETEILDHLRRTVPGFAFEFVSMTDWAFVRAIRLLQETWRPETHMDKDPYDK